MGRGIHAGVEAGAAIVTEVGEIDNIAIGEDVSPLQRGIDRAVALAETTAVADIELPLRLGKELSYSGLGSQSRNSVSE
jgi:hypothetical protein